MSYDKITFYTVNPYNDDYFKNNEPARTIERLCFKTWAKKFNVKVFDYNSKIVKECIEKYKWIYEHTLKHPYDKCIFADLVRLTVLARYKYHFYFDCDLYLKSFNLKDTEHFQCNNGFMSVYNGNDVATASKLLQVYKEGEILRDREVIAKSGLKIRDMKGVDRLHLCNFDNAPDSAYMCYTNDIQQAKQYINKYITLIKPSSMKKLLMFTDRRNSELKDFIPRLYTPKSRPAIVLKSLFGIPEEDRSVILQEVRNHWDYLSV